MSKRLIFVAIGILIAALISPSLFACSTDDASGIIGSKAPPFELYDLDGNLVALEDFAGRPVVINFWQTTCPYCLGELPLLEEFHLTLSDTTGAVVLAINIYENDDTVRQVVEEEGLSLLVLLDPQGSAASKYGVRGIPANFFIDGKGVIRAVRLGQLTSVQQIEQILEEMHS